METTSLTRDQMEAYLSAEGLTNFPMQFSHLYKGVATFKHPHREDVVATVGYATHQAAYELEISNIENLNVHSFDYIRVGEAHWEDENSYW